MCIRDRTTQGRTASASVTGYILIDLGASYTSLPVDCIIIEGEVLAGDSVTVTASTALTGGTALDTPTTVFSTALSTSRTVLISDNSYQARYWLLTFTGGGNAVRGFRQLWLGAQTQLSYSPRVPGDLDERVTTFSRFVTESGAVHSTEKAYNLRRVDHVLPLATAAEHTLVESAYASSRGWTAPIWYLPFPTSSPSTGAIYLAVKNGELSKPDFTGGTAGGRAEWNLDGAEVGPRIL